jgi:hypothetical protein
MEPSTSVIDTLYRDRVLRARQESLEAKFLAGAELFEQVCVRMRAGLIDENPGADGAMIEQLLRNRLERLRRLERPQ